MGILNPFQYAQSVGNAFLFCLKDIEGPIYNFDFLYPKEEPRLLELANKKLYEAMRRHGYSDDVIESIASNTSLNSKIDFCPVNERIYALMGQCLLVTIPLKEDNYVLIYLPIGNLSVVKRITFVARGVVSSDLVEFYEVLKDMYYVKQDSFDPYISINPLEIPNGKPSKIPLIMPSLPRMNSTFIVGRCYEDFDAYKASLESASLDEIPDIEDEDGFLDFDFADDA